MMDFFLNPLDMIQSHDLCVGVSPDFLRRLFRNIPNEGLCFCNRCFDIQPTLELVFFLEDSPHLWTAIAARVDWKNGQSYRLEPRRHQPIILNNSEEEWGNNDWYLRPLRTRSG